jgi:hypothetical protein
MASRYSSYSYIVVKAGMSRTSVRARWLLRCQERCNPLGTSDPLSRDFYWQPFTQGIDSPRQADWGDIALQVLAFQSGGQVFNLSNDIAGELHQCPAAAQAYYEIPFVPSSDQPREPYHRTEVRIDKPGHTARTLPGYYAQQSAP